MKAVHEKSRRTMAFRDGREQLSLNFLSLPESFLLFGEIREPHFYYRSRAGRTSGLGCYVF